MNVSIVVPAYNAAETIQETLASIQAQTVPNWEAIVVNDGSTDETEAIVQEIAAQDSRIRLFSQSNQGVSAARNTAISHVRYDWLGFLDADDWLAPQYVERMTAALAADPSLDAVHCGIRRLEPDGQTIFDDRYAPSETDLFPVFAVHCPFMLHSCIFRKRLAEEIGGFDTSFRNAADWDFWQRLARTGTRFGAVKEVLGFYRIQANSLSRGANTKNLFAAGRRVMLQGHAPDPRVPNPHPDHAAGEPPEGIVKCKYRGVGWGGGWMLGRGEDPKYVIELLGNDRDPNLDPKRVATHIFWGVARSSSQNLAAWKTIWPQFEEKVWDFLQALEVQSQAPDLARNSQIILERLILQSSPLTQPLTIGNTHGVPLEMTEPLLDVDLPSEAKRLYGFVTLEGTELGWLELPVQDGRVSSGVIKEAIASQFSYDCELDISRKEGIRNRGK